MVTDETTVLKEMRMGVIGADGQKHYLFATLAEEEAAVKRSPLYVVLELTALAERVGAIIETSKGTT